MGTTAEGYGCCLGGLLRDSPMTEASVSASDDLFLTPGNCFCPCLCSPSLDSLPIRVAGGLTKQLIKILVCYSGEIRIVALRHSGIRVSISLLVTVLRKGTSNYLVVEFLSLSLSLSLSLYIYIYVYIYIYIFFFWSPLYCKFVLGKAVHLLWTDGQTACHLCVVTHTKGMTNRNI